MQLPRGDGEENKVNDKLGQNAEHAPLPRAIEKSNAPGADEHPDVVRVNEREHQNVGFALVVRAVAAPAGTLVEELLPCVHRSGFDHGILVEIVADLGVWNFHHLVDEHVVVAARKIDEVAEPAYFEEQLFLVRKACGACDYRAAKAKACGFHRGVAERFELLVKVRHGACAVVLFGALHDADSIDEPPGHGGNPAFARDAVGIHCQKHFVFCNFERAFKGPLFGACDDRQILR